MGNRKFCLVDAFITFDYHIHQNLLSILGAIWPSLSPCTVINPILLTYLLSILGESLIQHSTLYMPSPKTFAHNFKIKWDKQLLIQTKSSWKTLSEGQSWLLDNDKPWCSHKHIESLRWCHNERDSVSNHQPHDCLLNRLFRRRSNKTSKLRVVGLCAGNSPRTGEFPAQMASNTENVSIWWRLYVFTKNSAWYQSEYWNAKTNITR